MDISLFSKLEIFFSKCFKFGYFSVSIWDLGYFCFSTIRYLGISLILQFEIWAVFFFKYFIFLWFWCLGIFPPILNLGIPLILQFEVWVFIFFLTIINLDISLILHFKIRVFSYFKFLNLGIYLIWDLVLLFTTVLHLGISLILILEFFFFFT